MGWVVAGVSYAMRTTGEVWVGRWEQAAVVGWVVYTARGWACVLRWAGSTYIERARTGRGR